MLDAAVAALAPLLANMLVSSRMETKALLLPDSPDEWNLPFLNMAVCGDCRFDPYSLMKTLKDIERRLGRIDRGRWSPREIDLDILVYDDLEINLHDLIIPHPQLLNRDFAFKPLLEIAPDSIINGKTAKEWKKLLP